jgi:hypothetical protein
MRKRWEELGARENGAALRCLNPATPPPDPQDRAPEVL